MFSVVYYERQAAEHPRAVRLLRRFSALPQVACRHYGEVFNRRQQNFRLQKQAPALILAQKKNRLVLPAPAEYHIGGERNFYFSHMLNCLYDCRYCFLQGMYSSAHYVLFVNYEDFFSAIEQSGSGYYFSGYDCDSLALEPVTGFVGAFLPLFRDLPDNCLELRTKSTQVRELLKQPPLANCIVAFSFTPQNVSQQLEHKVPGIDRRLKAMRALQCRGWKVGLRFDPLIYHRGYEDSYSRLFEQVFAQLDSGLVHSVSLGVLRMPQDFFRRMHRLYPREKLFAAALEPREGFVAYPDTLEQQMVGFCRDRLLRYVSAEKLYTCELAD